MADLDLGNPLEELGQKPRGRRAQVERAQRRRRVGVDADNSALAVSEEVKRDLAQKGLEGRWINDLGNRMYNKTVNDDWDKVPDVEPAQVGVDSRTGKPVTAYFCAKPKEFIADDNRDRIQRIDASEKATFSGRDNGELNEGAYNPLEASYVRRGQ
jgi:hypothetical protein